MRNISSGGLALLASREWEPIVILEIDWAGNGHPISYADRTVDSIKGRILEVGELDNIINIDSSNSQQISVTLDDTDGTIKSILDSHDVQQQPVSVYQFFDGLDLSDKFLLFKGKIKSPIVWSEGDRTVSLSIEAILEDNEFGFSAEEGDFPFIPKGLIGKPWPVIFGLGIDIPGIQVNTAVSGTTLAGVGIISGAAEQLAMSLGQTNCSLGQQLGLASIRISLLDIASDAWRQARDFERADDMLKQANQMREQISQAVASYQQQQACAIQQRQNVLSKAQEHGLGANPLPILGLEDFPQNTTIRLNINGGLFTGVARADGFHISSRRHPDSDTKVASTVSTVTNDACSQQPPFGNTTFDESVDLPNGKIRQTGFFVCTDAPPSTQPDQIAEHFWAEPGSRVVMDSDEPMTYLVSITPGTVLAVKAWKTLDGDKRLVNVPNDLWTVASVNYGPVTAVQVTIKRPLSTIVDQGWSDDVFITFQSAIGPNTVDILKYIVERWTSLDWDATTFNAVRTKVDKFPMNFAVLERENTIDVIKKIALAARCAVWIDNDLFKLKYLPEEPDADDTITVSDIVNKSIEVELTPTEDIQTKITVRWRLSWADETPEQIILRRNVDKYGTKAGELDLTYFNQPDVALHAATFWLIRKCNTWKRIKFKTYLHKLNLETFDTVLLDLPSYVASEPVKAMVEQANYNSADNTIDFQCLVPVRAGEMAQYKFFWPADVADRFEGDGSIQPTTQGLPIGYTGVIGIPGQPVVFKGQFDAATNYAVNDAVLFNGESYVCIRRSTGNLPNNSGFWKLISLVGTGTVFVGGPNVLYLSGAGSGSLLLLEALFFAQSIYLHSQFGQVQAGPNPRPNLRLNYQLPPNVPQIPQVQNTIGAINVKTQRFYDPDVDGRSTTFDFRYDEDSKVWGAGTAFLKDKSDEEGTP